MDIFEHAWPADGWGFALVPGHACSEANKLHGSACALSHTSHSTAPKGAAAGKVHRHELKAWVLHHLGVILTVTPPRAGVTATGRAAGRALAGLGFRAHLQQAEPWRLVVCSRLHGGWQRRVWPGADLWVDLQTLCHPLHEVDQQICQHLVTTVCRGRGGIRDRGGIGRGGSSSSSSGSDSFGMPWGWGMNATG